MNAANCIGGDELLNQSRNAGHAISLQLLEEVVENNDNKRFSFGPDGLRIRVNQGHSVEVDLGLPVLPPPDTLFQGAASRLAASTLGQGLIRQARHHVPLTHDPQTALAVGQRHSYTPRDPACECQGDGQAGP